MTPHLRLVTTMFNEASTLPALAKGCIDIGIDSWVILDDVESTDGSAELAKELFSGIPGRVIRKPFSNFGTLARKRNYLYNTLKSTRKGADYLFVPQSDEPPEGFLDKETLTEDIYLVTVKENSLEFQMPLIFKADIPCKWVGSYHECLTFEGWDGWETCSHGRIDTLYTVRSGSNATPEDRINQGRILKAEADKGDIRSMFYLASTMVDLGWFEQAIGAYLRRANMTIPDEETFYSLMTAGVLMEPIDEELAEELWKRAISQRPHRVEPYYLLANMYNRHGNFGAALKHAQAGASLPSSKDMLWINRWVETDGIHLQVQFALDAIGKVNDNSAN